MITGNNLKKQSNANTFNNTSDWSNTNGGITTNRGGSDAYITVDSDFDESNFVQRTGSIRGVQQYIGPPIYCNILLLLLLASPSNILLLLLPKHPIFIAIYCVLGYTSL